MVDNLTVYGELLTASASEGADGTTADTRTLTYRLLPYGEKGNTSAGTITAARGTVTYPDDVTILPVNIEHDGLRPVGRFVSITETDTGLEASVRIVKTRDGDDALELASEKLRAGISVEIDSPVIRSGKLISGSLTGAGLVVRPAFTNALLVANDCGEIPDEKETNMENHNEETVEVSPVQAAPLHASHDRVDLAERVYAAVKEGRSLEAAFAVPADDAGKVYIADQEVGELFEARRYQRPIIEKIGVKPLTSLVVTGTKRTRATKLQDWQGSPTKLPTMDVVKTTREYWNAEAKAGTVSIGMELIEFGGRDAVADVLSDATDNYIVESEKEVLAELLYDSGLGEAQKTADHVADIGAALSQLGAIGARGDIIVVSPNVFADLSRMKAADLPWWFGNGTISLGDRTVSAGEVTFTTSTGIGFNQILVLDSRAVDYRETKDFTYRAVNVSYASQDVAAVKFRALKVTDPGAGILVQDISGVLNN